jgi:CHAT domain-containing protein/tetratricopeptide (TPR) repeat protein
MRRRLYPKDQYSRGHPDLAQTLNNLGQVFKAKGKYREALDAFRRTLTLQQSFFPKDIYPQGHPLLAATLENRASVLHAQEKYAEAFDDLKQALAMRQALADLFTAGSSEAEALHFAGRLPATRDALLCVSHHLPNSEKKVYDLIWRSKAAVMQCLEARQRELRQMLLFKEQPGSRGEQARLLWDKLLTTRRALARLLLQPARDHQAHRKRIERYTQDKEALESQLAKLLPTSGQGNLSRHRGPAALARKLPRGTVFVDFLRYVRFNMARDHLGNADDELTWHYVAFVLCRNRAVRRVPLGEAGPIERALHDWRQEVRDKKTGSAAQKLRRLLWEPLARHLPRGTRSVFLAPDSALARLPWAALPTNRQGRVLLESHAVAVVPHGPYLLESLCAGRRQSPDRGLLLAVGGVSYGESPETGRRQAGRASHRTAEWNQRSVLWQDLPGAQRELEKVVEPAGSRPVLRLAGTRASTQRLLAELPRARFVHVATHGFFADKRFRSLLQIDEGLFEKRSFREGAPPGARNPLVLSGLVLAGANLPLPKDLKERTESDGGILTAEAIAGLPLHKLELVVLSACETGLGEVAGGEGVFGLQRAFHLAGAKNVVASLWKVDDQPTAALMALFYDKLWRQNKPAVEALREAQLTLYHHPERIATLAKERGPNFDKVVRLPLTPGKETKPSTTGKAATKLWAGFVLSGLGR